MAAKKKKVTSSTVRPEIVQWLDKEIDRYVKFERATAKIISEKVTAGPYKNIHVAKRRPVVRKRKKVSKKTTVKKIVLVQVRNPKSDRYVKIDKTNGIIISTKSTPGPYKGVTVVKSSKVVKNEPVTKKKVAKKKVATPKKKATKKKASLKKPKKPRKVNYLNNKDILAEVASSKEVGKMSNKLAHMLQTLCARYGRRGNFANYTYNEDMQAYAMMMLVRTWNSFNPAKSNNPFAFFTQCIKNSFIQYLNQEKRHRVTRDELMVNSGLNPSYNYQMAYEEKMKEQRQADTALHEEKEDYTKNQTSTKDKSDIIEF